MKFSVWGASDIGQARKVNEDSFLLAPDLGLVAVADGMGGPDRGDMAAALACSVLKERISDEREILEGYRRMPTPARRDTVRLLLERACQQACEEVHRAARSIAMEGGQVGTTLDAVLLCGNTAFTAHVGDGRIYLSRAGEMHQLTDDHSLVEEQVREGKLTAEEARRSRQRHVVTRALGIFPNVRVDTLHFDVDMGDRFLLCTDGLHRYLTIREKAYAISQEQDDKIPGMLVDAANAKGCRDNVTAVLVRVDQETHEARPSGGKEKLEVLRRVDLFRFCTYRELVQVQLMTTERTVPAGTVLFQDGDRGDELFLVLAGRVAVEKEGTILSHLQPPQYFGEMCFIDHPHRSASARAVEDSTFLIFRRDMFMQMMKKDSELAAKISWQLLVKLSRLLRETNERAVGETLLLDESEPEESIEVG